MGDYHYKAMAGPHTGTGEAQGRTARPLPKRGDIKRKIFSSMAAAILDGLKRIGTTLAKILDGLKRICSLGQATTTASEMDLLQPLEP